MSDIDWLGVTGYLDWKRGGRSHRPDEPPPTTGVLAPGRGLYRFLADSIE